MSEQGVYNTRSGSLARTCNVTQMLATTTPPVWGLIGNLGTVSVGAGSSMAKYTRTSGGVHCRAFNCNSGYYNHVEGQKKSLFNFPKDEERYVNLFLHNFNSKNTELVFPRCSFLT